MMDTTNATMDSATDTGLDTTTLVLENSTTTADVGNDTTNMTIIILPTSINGLIASNDQLSATKDNKTYQNQASAILLAFMWISVIFLV